MDENEAMFAGFCGALAALSESYGTILLLCCSFITIDLATGLAKAKIEGRTTAPSAIKVSGARLLWFLRWYSVCVWIR